MLMESRFEEESTAILIGSQTRTINFACGAARETATGLIGWVYCRRLSAARKNAIRYTTVFHIEFSKL